TSPRHRGIASPPRIAHRQDGDRTTDWEKNMAKYLISWKARQNGTAQQNHDDVKKTLATFAKWQPRADQNFLQFVQRVDGQGGYAVVETDNPAGIGDGPSKF